MMPVLGVAAGGKPFEYPVPAELWRPNGVVFIVDGDSMDDGTERAIKDGEMLLVDTSLTDLQSGKLYVVEIIGDGYTVKEARRINGEWVLLPWNPNHPVLKPHEARVVGQVYASGLFRKR
jgi:repressor LexA